MFKSSARCFFVIHLLREFPPLYKWDVWGGTNPALLYSLCFAMGLYKTKTWVMIRLLTEHYWNFVKANWFFLHYGQQSLYTIDVCMFVICYHNNHIYCLGQVFFMTCSVIFLSIPLSGGRAHIGQADRWGSTSIPLLFTIFPNSTMLQLMLQSQLFK